MQVPLLLSPYFYCTILNSLDNVELSAMSIGHQNSCIYTAIHLDCEIFVCTSVDDVKDHYCTGVDLSCSHAGYMDLPIQ